LFGIARFYFICYLCVSGDGVGFWGVSFITAISRPDGSFVRGCLFASLFGFSSFEVLAAFGFMERSKRGKCYRYTCVGDMLQI
jgi:hypothetical protein